ncbi:MbnP family protein [Hymenobacter bucti]|uniref:MbnP family protein n=1 Tax=Hymenobacter bucti TaxID=1844114 RepID=A0ABW4QW46_9BACT
MKTRLSTLLGLLVVPLALFSGCKKDSDSLETTGPVNITVRNVAGSQDLALNSTVATTAAGETFTVSTFEYYLSNIKFTKSDGTTYAAPDTYFLVNQAKPSSLSFMVPNVPAGDYTGVSFIVGVDAQKTGLTDPTTFTGDLNQANAMYWTWNSGHIFMKLEGTITSTSPAKPLTCHIGGYTDPNNAIVTAAPAFNGAKLTVQANHTSQLHLAANVTKIFDGPTPTALSTFTGVHMPSTQSVQLAQNYAAGMFTVKKITTD